jgi:predicted DNA-binding protein
MTREQLSIRISEGLNARLRAATDRDKNPYAPSVTQIVERGIELALKELERKARK